MRWEHVIWDENKLCGAWNGGKSKLPGIPIPREGSPQVLRDSFLDGIALCARVFLPLTKNL